MSGQRRGNSGILGVLLTCQNLIVVPGFFLGPVPFLLGPAPPRPEYHGHPVAVLLLLPAAEVRGRTQIGGAGVSACVPKSQGSGRIAQVSSPLVQEVLGEDAFVVFLPSRLDTLQDSLL